MSFNQKRVFRTCSIRSLLVPVRKLGARGGRGPAHSDRMQPVLCRGGLESKTSDVKSGALSFFSAVDVFLLGVILTRRVTT